MGKIKAIHSCSLCDFQCALRKTLQDHIRVHTREKPFVCDQCKCKFSRKSSLNTHTRRFHQEQKMCENQIYKCSLCVYATPKKEHLEAHVLAHTEERIFPCQHPGCRYAALTYAALERHKANKHENKREFLCQFPNCGYRGNTKAHLKLHSLTHSEHRRFICDFEGCSYRAKRMEALRVHKLGVHHGGYKPFACSMCNYCTTTKTLLKSHHWNVHMDRKPVKCDFSGCAISCTSKASLVLHVLRHHTERKFKCDFEGCHSTAYSLAGLEEHKKRVHYAKVHKCPHCDFRALYPSVLEEHITLHSARQQVIKCPKAGCDFQARRPKTMRQHLRCHEANLGCPVEGCSYFGKSKRHMKTHDPTGRTFHCPLCPKYFSTNKILSRHLFTHTKEKPFQCPTCNFGAMTKTNLRTHMRNIHQTALSKAGEGSICDHCSVDFGSAVGLAMHWIKLKRAVVVLTRL